MRLVCPNCSAQYEIDGSMIPDGGRDVQCSNCGHTWFELPPPVASGFEDMEPGDFGQAAALDDEDDGFDTLSDDDTVGTEVSDGLETDADDEQIEAAAEGSSQPDEDEDDTATNFDDDGAETADVEEEEVVETDIVDETTDEDLSPSGAVAAAAAAALADDEAPERVTTEPTTLKPRRPADAAALDILREEAEREMSQRRGPASIETQTDMGLDDIRRRQTPSRALRARMAHLGEDDPVSRDTPASVPPPSEPEVYQEPRRDLLPDIDEINSTLKPASGAADGAQRGGFRTGFILMMLITAALILCYAQAPALARAFPGAESTLISYVDSANSVRDWIQGLFAE